jgi:hypothetical protein
MCDDTQTRHAIDLHARSDDPACPASSPMHAGCETRARPCACRDTHLAGTARPGAGLAWCYGSLCAPWARRRCRWATGCPWPRRLPFRRCALAGGRGGVLPLAKASCAHRQVIRGRPAPVMSCGYYCGSARPSPGAGRGRCVGCIRGSGLCTHTLPGKSHDLQQWSACARDRGREVRHSPRPRCPPGCPDRRPGTGGAPGFRIPVRILALFVGWIS